MGLCILSLVMGVEFFIGLDVLDIEKWLANHPYQMILALAVSTWCVGRLILPFLGAESLLDEKPSVSKRLKSKLLIGLITSGLVSVFLFSDDYSLSSYIQVFQSKEIKIIALAALYGLDFILFQKMRLNFLRQDLFFGILVFGALTNILVVSLLFQEFLSIAALFGVNSVLYAFLLGSGQKLLLGITAVFLSLSAVAAQGHGVELEYCLVVIFGFVLIQYLLRSSSKC